MVAARKAQEALDKPLSYGFNLNSLSKFYTKEKPKVLFWGDSITAGPGPLNSYVGRIWQSLQMAYGQGSKIYSLDTATIGLLSGWNIENKGVNLFRAKGAVGCADYSFTPHKIWDSKVDLYYSTESDGGSFDILIDGVVNSTVNCKKEKSHANKITITVPANKLVTIKNKGDGNVYIDGLIIYEINGLTSPMVYQMGHGGMGSNNYEDIEIEATIKKFPVDLVIISHIMNDHERTTPEVYKRKIELAINYAKSNGSAILLMPHGRPRKTTIDQSTLTKWNEFENILKSLAKEKGCAFLSVTDYWDGYSNDFLLADGVHPNTAGNTSIYNILSDLLVPKDVANNIFKISQRGDKSGYYTLAIELDQDKYLDNSLFVANDLIPINLKGFDSADGVKSTANSGGNSIHSFYNKNNEKTVVIESYGGGKFGGIILYSGNNLGVIYHYADVMNIKGQSKIVLDVQKAEKNDPNNGTTIVPAAQFQNGLRLVKGGTFKAGTEHYGDMKFDNDFFFKGRNATVSADMGTHLVGEWAFQQCWSTPTVGRIPKPKIGMMMFDTTLGKPIWCKSVAVVDSNGTITTPAVWVDSIGSVV